MNNGIDTYEAYMAGGSRRNSSRWPREAIASPCVPGSANRIKNKNFEYHDDEPFRQLPGFRHHQGGRRHGSWHDPINMQKELDHIARLRLDGCR